jgi:hypothetical protein
VKAATASDAITTARSTVLSKVQRGDASAEVPKCRQSAPRMRVPIDLGHANDVQVGRTQNRRCGAVPTAQAVESVGSGVTVNDQG